MKATFPRIVIAGTHSGVGKTTIVTGIVAALAQRGYRVQPFKVGPDYIDPGFHALAAGRPSYNLDTWLVSEEKLDYNFSVLADDADISVIEGVMGLYDGGAGGVSSSADIALRLNAPVVLVVNAQSMGQSAGAVALGYQVFNRDVNLAGVILNRVGSDRHAEMTREAVESVGIPVLGIIRRNEQLQTPERHLGLTPVTELSPESVIAQMRAVMDESIDWERLLEIARNAPDIHPSWQPTRNTVVDVRIGIAQDEAFSFYYPTGLRYLEFMGATLVPFSPLKDDSVPENINGLIFGGGFPEMFLDTLSRNTSMLASVRQAASAGMPIYAECGGLMYLCRELRGFDERVYPMVGVVPAVTEMQQRLQRVGYVTATALRDSVIVSKEMTLRGHEFHFSKLVPDHEDTFPWAYDLQGTRQRESHREGYAEGNVLASYLHIAWDGNEAAAQKWLQSCQKFQMR